MLLNFFIKNLIFIFNLWMGLKYNVEFVIILDFFLFQVKNIRNLNLKQIK